MVDSLCFGSKKIIDRMREEGIIIDSVIGMGGVAKKSPFIMQMMADVLDMVQELRPRIVSVVENLDVAATLKLVERLAKGEESGDV